METLYQTSRNFCGSRLAAEGVLEPTEMFAQFHTDLHSSRLAVVRLLEPRGCSAQWKFEALGITTLSLQYLFHEFHQSMARTRRRYFTTATHTTLHVACAKPGLLFSRVFLSSIATFEAFVLIELSWKGAFDYYLQSLPWCA